MKIRRNTVKNPRRSARNLSIEPLEPRLALDASALRITELVASNDNSLQDYDGDSSDWLEIYNSGVDQVDMSGFHLTDNAANLAKYTFPNGTIIPAGGYKVVFASDKNTVKPNGEIHTNFKLGAEGEYLGLIAADGLTVLDAYAPNFPGQVEDVSYGRAMTPTGASTTLVASGAVAKAWVPTSSALDATWRNVGFNEAQFPISGQTGFGYENNPGDGTNYVSEIKTSVPSGTRTLYVRITFNLATLAGVDQLKLRMKYDDGFVAYINGVEVAEANAPDSPQWNSLATTTHNDPDAKVFQDFDVNAAVQHLRVGANVLAIHALNTPTTSSDFLVLPELIASSVQIVTPDDIGYMDVPTPGYGNAGQTFAGFVNQPTMSVPHGLYGAAQALSLSTTTPGAIIVYTTDASTPTVNASLGVTNGTLYTGALINITGTTTLRAVAFKLDYKPSFVTTSTYIFTSDVITQSLNGAPPPGFPADNPNDQRMFYGIDPAVVNQYQNGSQLLKNSLAGLPTISITTDLANLFDPATGIYMNAQNRGRPWERPASIELINPDGSPGFTTNAGLRIRGGYSRNDFNPKHAFRLYFRGEYGDSHLDFPMFGDEGASVFDVLDFRAEQNYSWSSGGDSQNSMVREVFGRDLQRDLGEPYTRSRYYQLYIDGVYWGLYQSQERVEEFYGETYFGGTEEDYDVVKSGLADFGGTEVSSGNDAAWRQLFNYGEQLAANPAGNANVYWTMQGLNPDGTRNPALPVLLDADNLIDYMSIIFYTGGYDSGLSRFIGPDNQANNWFGIYNHTTADAGFQFFIHDNEHSMGAGDGVHGTVSIDRTGPFNNGNQSNYAQFNPQYLHQDLLANPEYRQKFIDHVQKNFFNGGEMTVEKSVARIQARAAQVAPGVIAEAARWGNMNLDRETWQAEINWLVNSYLPVRGNIVLNQLRNDGIYTTFAAPAFNQHGGVVSDDFDIKITSGAGTIYYTTDGVTDPRVIGGVVNLSAAVKTYVDGFNLTGPAKVMARLRTAAGQWSGLVEADFTGVIANWGEYTGDDVVDGEDILAWQRTLGTQVGAPRAGADGSGNGFVDADDLPAWVVNFGNNFAASGAASSSSFAAALAASPLFNSGTDAESSGDFDPIVFWADEQASAQREAPSRRAGFAVTADARDSAYALIGDAETTDFSYSPTELSAKLGPALSRAF